MRKQLHDLKTIDCIPEVESAQAGFDQGFLWRRQWHPTPVLLPGESHEQRSLVGCSPWGRQESDTTEELHFHFSLSCIAEGNGNPLQCSSLENPRDGRAWWAAISGVAQNRTLLKRLSSRIQVSISRMPIISPLLSANMGNLWIQKKPVFLRGEWSRVQRERMGCGKQKMTELKEEKSSTTLGEKRVFTQEKIE